MVNIVYISQTGGQETAHHPDRYATARRIVGELVLSDGSYVKIGGTRMGNHQSGNRSMRLHCTTHGETDSYFRHSDKFRQYEVYAYVRH